MRKKILEVKNLRTYFYTYAGVVKALDGINFEIFDREIMGLVGETGCGKSVTARSIIGLISYPGRIEEGEIIFKGDDLLKIGDQEMRKLRGKDIAMIFQEPIRALNPLFTVGEQISEVLLLHDPRFSRSSRHKSAAMVYSAKLLRDAGIANPNDVVKMYPHELSGGMCQRAMIAMAIACNPALLIADEPTTALDVTVQAQILDLILKLVKEHSSSVLLITHNLGIIAETCDRCAVMYAGNIVEVADVIELFKNPVHPYTIGLLNAIPKGREKLEEIKGTVPNLISPPEGCRFHPRCKLVMERCRSKTPELIEVKSIHPQKYGPHMVACWAEGVRE